MRLALLAPSLAEGGAARVLCLLAEGWADRGEDVTVLTLAGSDDDFFALPSRVDRIGLEVEGSSAGPVQGAIRNFRRLRALRSALRRIAPDAAVAFLPRTNVLTVLAAVGTGVPVVVSVRADPRRLPLPRPWPLLRRLVFRRAAAVVVQTDAVAVWARRWLPPERVHVVPNPVEAPSSGERSPGPPRIETPTSRVAAGIGRLVPQKGFDLLLEAFARSAEERPAWSLVLLGEGPERRRLEELADRLGVADRVRLPGHVASPWRRLPRVDLFVLSSRYEGFPNVLLEAMARGIACVAFDCPAGPSEILRHGRDGLLVPPEDVGRLAAAMGRLMDDERERRALGERARSVCRRFAPERILDRWEEVLQDATGG